MAIKFFYNGIKEESGKLIKVYYSLENNREHTPMVAITCKSPLDSLPNALVPINSTDIRTDYVDCDYVRLTPGDTYYQEARAAAEKAEVKSAKKKVEHYTKLVANGTRHNELYMSEINYYNEIIKKYA